MVILECLAFCHSPCISRYVNQAIGKRLDVGAMSQAKPVVNLVSSEKIAAPSMEWHVSVQDNLFCNGAKDRCDHHHWFTVFRSYPSYIRFKRVTFVYYYSSRHLKQMWFYTGMIL